MTDGYRGQHMPVAIDAAFIKRVQSVDMNQGVPINQDYELGTEQAVGGSEDPHTHAGSMTWLPIDNTMEARFAKTTNAAVSDATPLSLLDFSAVSPVVVATPKESILGARMVSLDYGIRVGGGFTGTVTFEGSARSAGTTITADTPTGQGSYRSPDIVVTVGGTATIRAQGANIRAGFRVDRLFELGTLNPVLISLVTPTVTAGIDWVESDLKAGLAEPSIGSPQDIILQVGSASGGKRLTVVNAVFAGKGSRSVINGFSTIRFNYEVVQDATYGGLKIDTIP